MKIVSIAMVYALAMPAWAAPVFTGKQMEVANVERAFAATMKARDHAAFAGFLSDEAVWPGLPARSMRRMAS
jgi:hypothetical protein